MPIAQEKLEKILLESFPQAQFKVIDLAGDDNHYRLEISDKIFAGKTKIQQHKIVNEALKNYINSGELHALQLQTKIP